MLVFGRPIYLTGMISVFVKAADAEHGKLGGKITLVPTVKGQMDEILWKHKGNKVVEFDGSQNKEFGSYVGRTVLDFVTGELIISALTTEDSGHYELEAHINNLLKYSQHQVEVIGKFVRKMFYTKVMHRLFVSILLTTHRL